MPGITDLALLLESMKPELSSTDYIFCTMRINVSEIIQYEPWAIINEKEGITVIITKETAEKHKINYKSLFNRITLTVHSSLNAVGLTAKISAKLMELGMSANIVAGYYHDHIFIQKEHSEKALKGLLELSGANSDF